MCNARMRIQLISFACEKVVKECFVEPLLDSVNLLKIPSNKTGGGLLRRSAILLREDLATPLKAKRWDMYTSNLILDLDCLFDLLALRAVILSRM